jgi:hypothetical protein
MDISCGYWHAGSLPERARVKAAAAWPQVPLINIGGARAVVYR